MGVSKDAAHRKKRKLKAARKKDANARAHARAGRKALSQRSTRKATKKRRKANDGGATNSLSSRRSRSLKGSITKQK